MTSTDAANSMTSASTSEKSYAAARISSAVVLTVVADLIETEDPKDNRRLGTEKSK